MYLRKKLLLKCRKQKKRAGESNQLFSDEDDESEKIKIDFKGFCGHIQQFVDQLVETEQQQQAAAVAMKEAVESRFKGLTQKMMQANKKLIIKTVIRRSWPSILEQLYQLVKIQPGVKWDDQDFQESIKSIQNKVKNKSESDSCFLTSPTGKQTFHTSIIRILLTFCDLSFQGKW